ncbi:hypothetical protein HC031_07420 [Planosporangium thailandense]|uniref:Uncharacterized protein n=1 Tax=Planosporangium thailandense TaxID=765197 RepID=A0ABX0XUS1_9ACTN|nr:hypothetical protein [Planosporangium thailandense]NJC69551.1 hypothetical protein [Planosporangium thailandense]
MTVEDIAVPKWNVVDEFMAALGEAAADAGPHMRAEPKPAPEWRALHPPPQAPEPPRPGPIYIYPWINRDLPWGCGTCGPMGEGSEDAAVPPVDPAEARLNPDELHLVASEPEEPGEAILEEKEREGGPRRPREA